eukprot:330395-Hanusia_phi.AAC.1
MELCLVYSSQIPAWLTIHIEQRLQRIRQNRELLISLGIASELEGLSNLSRDDNEDSNSAKDAKRRRTSTAVEAAPTRTLRSRVKTGSVKENSFRELKEKVLNLCVQAILAHGQPFSG